MMIPFIARMIMQEADKSLERGQDKYRAYFVNTHLYVKWQEDVNTILRVEGHEEIIVAK